MERKVKLIPFPHPLTFRLALPGVAPNPMAHRTPIPKVPFSESKNPWSYRIFNMAAFPASKLPI